MDILTLAMTGAGGVGIGVVLGGLVLRPRVGPWYGSRPCQHSTPVSVTPAPHPVTLTGHQVHQIIAPAPGVPASLETAYVNTTAGLVPVLVSTAALAAGTPVLPLPSQIEGGSK